VGAASQYSCARALNFDGLGDGRLEIAVAKGSSSVTGQWVIYDHTTALTDTQVTSSSLYVRHYGYSAISGTDGINMADTMFEIYDVNGDGYSDVLTCWRTVGDAGEVSLLKLYLNLYPDGFFEVDVKDVFAGMLAGTEKGTIVKVISADVYLRE
jgi:hypothetical protein